MTKKPTLITLAALAAGALLAVATPMAASAHVTIDPGSAAAGSYTVITVKVPNESETASTNRVEVTLPTDTPFSSVRYVPVAGWTAELIRETLPSPVVVGDQEITEAVTRVVWTAAPGSEIAAGQLQLFPLSVGPVPDTGSLLLSADQTYTDGEVVSWSEEGPDAEHPAPVLYINDAPPGDSHGAEAEEPAAAHEDEPELASVAATSSEDVLARVLGIAGLVLGAAGIVFGITARRAKAS